MQRSILLFILILTISASFLNVTSAKHDRNLAGESPFTAKASLIRYWKKQVTSNNAPSAFFLSKASPLTAVQLATYSKLAGQRSLTPNQLASFCKDANLFCFPDTVETSQLEKQSKDAKFSVYKFQNFTDYGSRRRGGVDTFRSYTNNETFPVNTFRRYSRTSADHGEKFNTYANHSIVATQTFSAYGTNATAGGGEFTNYNNTTSIIKGVKFTSYSESARSRTQDFKEYANNGAIGDQTFSSYGKNGTRNKFGSYGDDSSGVVSNFNNYSENVSGAGASADNFTSYGRKESITETNFESYGNGAKGITETFATYTPGASIPFNNFTSYGSRGNMVHQEFINYSQDAVSPHHHFTSYAADSKSQVLDFINYSQSFDQENFNGYAKNSSGQKVGFKTYKQGSLFKEYAKSGISFSTYVNETQRKGKAAVEMAETAETRKGKVAAKTPEMRVEPGKFFRERMLKTGTMMPMPDIRDKMPKRSFLPRSIFSKLPFSSSRIDELREIFHARDDSSLNGILTNALTECERAPSAGETKRCAGSGEDMIDFATSVLGKSVAVRTTENTRGSGGNVLIGSVVGMNGGKVTKSVSCHQSLYPSLLYYCHSVPKVRVYEADILDSKSMKKINHGVAICHIDTSIWSQGHVAFIALGSGPGKIEVCHWIFENDMTWTISN